MVGVLNRDVTLQTDDYRRTYPKGRKVMLKEEHPAIGNLRPRRAYVQVIDSGTIWDSEVIPFEAVDWHQSVEKEGENPANLMDMRLKQIDSAVHRVIGVPDINVRVEERGGGTVPLGYDVTVDLKRNTCRSFTLAEEALRNSSNIDVLVMVAMGPLHDIWT